MKSIHFNISFPGDKHGDTWFADWFLIDPFLCGWSYDSAARTVTFTPQKKVWVLTGNKQAKHGTIYHEAKLQ